MFLSYHFLSSLDLQNISFTFSFYFSFVKLIPNRSEIGSARCIRPYI